MNVVDRMIKHSKVMLIDSKSSSVSLCPTAIGIYSGSGSFSVSGITYGATGNLPVTMVVRVTILSYETSLTSLEEEL